MNRSIRCGVLLLVMVAGCDRAKTITDRKPEYIFGGRGLGNGQFDYPRAMDIGPDGCLYIVDKSARIQRFNKDGQFETSWRMPEFQAGKPTGITVGEDNRVWVADTHYHRVLVFDRDGKELHRFGSYGEGRGQFIFPSGVAIADDGTIYVSEFGGNDRISRFTSKYEYIDSIGGKDDDGVSIFSRPQALLLDDEQMLWVADACNHRVCRFTPDGELLSTIGSPGPEAGRLNYPYDLDWASDGTLLVCEFGNNRIQRFDRQGQSLETWGSFGTAPGQLCSPWAVKVSEDDRIYVLDSRNNRVQMFEM